MNITVKQQLKTKVPNCVVTPYNKWHRQQNSSFHAGDGDHSAKKPPERKKAEKRKIVSPER